MSQFKQNTGTLIIVVSRAKDLPNRRKMEKQNPYALLRIQNLTDKTKACIRGGQTPKWDEEFRFNLTPEIQPILKLSVLDETKKSPVFISEVEIDFTPVFYASVQEGYDNWYTLTAGSRDAGEVYLEMTFYPAHSNFISSDSQGSRTVKKTISKAPSSPSKRRDLPPIPGAQAPVKQEKESHIPPPVPRVPAHHSQPSFQSPTSPIYKDPLAKSTISIHALPDVPKNQSLSASPINRKPASNPYGAGFPQNAPSQPVSQQESASQVVTDDSEPLSKTLEHQTADPTDFISMTKKFASSISIFGSKPTQETKSVSNPFDELEREVQSDWEKNNPSRTSSSPIKKQPPPVPSHGSFNHSGSSLGGSRGSQTSLPPVPQHSTRSDGSSIANFDIIEPGQSFIPPASNPSTRTPSPQRRKPVSGIHSSPRLLNLNEIPFDASAIGCDDVPEMNKFRRTFNLHDTNRKPLPQKDQKDDEILEHHAPTPYEVFVKGAEKKGPRSAPKFNTSLPPRT